jgi:acyl carrier protein
VGEPSTREDDLNRQILDVIIAEGKVDPSRITPDATLESLEVESMDVVLILMAIEEKFDVYVPIDGQIAEAENLNRFVEIVADQVRKAHG